MAEQSENEQVPIERTPGYVRRYIERLERRNAELESAEVAREREYEPGASTGGALSFQEGGNHYRDMAIQPVVFIHSNKLGFCEGAVVKYMSRWREKGGLSDLRKARHFIDLLIEMELWNDTKSDRVHEN